VKTKQIPTNRARISPAALLGALAVLWNCAGAHGETLSIDGPRPIAQAARKLETIYMVPITYEDIRYVHKSETAIDGQGRLVAKGEAFSFAYEAPAENSPLEVRKSLAATAIANALKNYATLRGANMFSVTPTDEGFDIQGIGFTDTTGTTKKLQPLLDTPISITVDQKPAPEVLDEIAQQISAKTGRVVVSASRISTRNLITLNATNEPARFVLRDMLKQMPTGYETKPDAQGGTQLIPTSLSWALTCGTRTTPECGINVHVVAPEGRAVGSLKGHLATSNRPVN